MSGTITDATIVTNNSHKPSKEELLNELESIRTSLLPEGKDRIASGADNEPPFEDLAITREFLITTPEAESPSDSDDPNIPTLEKESLMTVLPGQQSLFGEDAKKSADKTQNEADLTSADDTEDTSGSTVVTPEQIAETQEHPAIEEEPAAPAELSDTQERENPFLPRHIKQKLEKEKSLYQQQLSETAPITPVVPATHRQTAQDNDALIDELVGAYLPKIEQELRQRLRESLNKQSQDEE
ncbi:MAG: hypothetical protein K6L80_14425 [Agarilytica sp.]